MTRKKMIKEINIWNDGEIVVKEEKISERLVKSNPTIIEHLDLVLPKYKPIPKALHFHTAYQSHRGLKGGVGSGKTYTLCADDILTSYINRPLLHLCTSPSFDNALVTVLPVLKEICDANGLNYEWEVSKNLFSIKHGSGDENTANILLYGADQPKFLKGITAASGSMNEPFTQKKEAFLIWWERIRHPKAKRLSRAWAGTAEPETMQWGHDYFKQEKFERPDFYGDTITTYDNPNLNAEYVQGLEERYDAKMREVYLYGKCLSISRTRAYYSFDYTKHIIPLHAALEAFGKEKTFYAPQKFLMPWERKYFLRNEIRKQIIISFDFNVNPMSAVEVWLCPPSSRAKSRDNNKYEILNTNSETKNNSEKAEGRTDQSAICNLQSEINNPQSDKSIYIQLAEYRIPSSNTAELCDLIFTSLKEKYSRGDENKIPEYKNFQYILTGDSSGRHSDTRSNSDDDYSIIRQKFEEHFGIAANYYINVPKKNPFVHDRIRYVNNLFEKGRFLICDNCVETIKDRELVQWKSGGDKFILDKSDYERTHLSDAGDYALWNTKNLSSES